MSSLNNYTTSPTLSPILLQHPSLFLSHNAPITFLVAGALVSNPHGQILLLRRAAHDSWPLQWEVPGGCVDPDDSSFVATSVRELWEETGLRATHVKAAVGLASEKDAQGEEEQEDMERECVEMMGDVCVFEVGSDVWGRLTVWINVESCDTVTIREAEHAEWAWVEEEEVRNERFRAGRRLEFASDGVRRTVLEGFRLLKEEKNNSQD